MKNIYSGKIILSIFVLIVTAFNSFSQHVNVNVFWQENSDAETIKFSKDDKTLFTGGSSGLNCYPATCGAIKQWNVADSSLKSTITGFFMGLTNSIALSANEKKIYSANGSSYCPGENGCYIDRPGIFNYNTDGSLNRTINPNGNGYALAISPDNKTIAVGTGYNNTGEIGLYDTNFNLLRTLAGHLYKTTDVAFTKDGKYLISGGYDGLVKFWNYKTGALVRTLTHGDYLNGGNNLNIATSPDGKLLASTGNGYGLYVKIWRIADGVLLSTIPLNIGTTGGQANVEFTPDGKYLAVATVQFSSKKFYYGKILFWNLKTKKIETIYKDDESKGIKSIVFSPDSKMMAYGGTNNTFKVAMLGYTNTAFVSEADNFSLHKNAAINASAYPNPFNSGTTITYMLQKTEAVNIKLFTVAGKEVATILNERQAAGTHQVFFDAKYLSEGFYIYKIHTSSFDAVNKLVKY